MTKEELGAKVQELRFERGLSRAELADLSFVSHATVRTVEAGINSPSVETLQMILKGLGITLEDFFKGDITGD